ncbi:MAG: hypothetical protein ACLGJA_02435 [Gammaproteobacteria bacterium]
MKRLSLMALTSAVLAASAGTSWAVSINDSVDKFTGIRKVSWTPVPSRPEEFTLTTALYVTKDSGLSRLNISLITWADHQQYESCNHTYWLGDGKRIDGMNEEYSVSFANGAVIETFKLNPTQEALGALEAAKRVEFKVCNTEGVVSENDLSGFKAVYAETKK